MTKAVADDIVDCCKTVVRPGGPFIDLAFEMGQVQGMTPEDIKSYIRFIADWRLRQLDLHRSTVIEENPLPWLQRRCSRRRARQLLRGPRDRILQGRDARQLGRGVGQFRSPQGREVRAGRQ